MIHADEGIRMNVTYFRAAILKQYAQKWPKRLPSAIAQLGLTTGQDGFFVGALHSAFCVKEIEFLPFARLPQLRRSDCVIVNSKSSLMKQKKYGVLEKFGSVPKVLFVASDKASYMPPDEVLDRFDLIYKREPYLDRDRYNIKPSNADKIKPTMLSCPFFRVKKKVLANGDSLGENTLPVSKQRADYQYSVGFNGSASSYERLEICEALASYPDADLRLQPHPKTGGAVPLQMRGSRVTRAEYMMQLEATKVNLALRGLGEFTYRHLEIWATCGFMISTPILKEIELPTDCPVEGKHYISFRDKRDLLEKIQYYTTNDVKREEVAKRGQSFYSKIYNYKQHGDCIKKEIFGRSGVNPNIGSHEKF